MGRLLICFRSLFVFLNDNNVNIKARGRQLLFLEELEKFFTRNQSVLALFILSLVPSDLALKT